MKVIVVGGGKIGYYLSKTLIEHGHYPSIIEIKRESCTMLANDLDIPVICGDGTTIETLTAAEIQNADALVSVTGKDEDNLIACQLAKKRFHVARTVARVNNPKNKDVLKRLGVDIPVSSTDNIARLIEREVDTSAIRELLSLNRGQATLSEVQIPDKYRYDGYTLSRLDLPVESVIVSITREEDLIIPRGNTQIKSGDKLIIIAKTSAIHALNEKLLLGDGKKKP